MKGNEKFTALFKPYLADELTIAQYFENSHLIEIVPENFAFKMIKDI